VSFAIALSPNRAIAWLKLRADVDENPIGFLKNKLRRAPLRLRPASIARFGCIILHYFARFEHLSGICPLVYNAR
jgi:hypothetical protein